MLKNVLNKMHLSRMHTPHRTPSNHGVLRMLGYTCACTFQQTTRITLPSFQANVRSFFMSQRVSSLPWWISEIPLMSPVGRYPGDSFYYRNWYADMFAHSKYSHQTYKINSIYRPNLALRGAQSHTSHSHPSIIPPFSLSLRSKLSLLIAKYIFSQCLFSQ